MNNVEKDKQIPGKTPNLEPEKNGNHAPNDIGVYDRPKQSGLLRWQFIILAILIIASAFIVYQLIF